MEKVRCFDIGGTQVVAADVSDTGQINELARTPTPTHSFTDFVEALKLHSPLGNAPIGVSIAGVLNPCSGIIQSANIPCLSGRSLQKELSTALSREVYLLNDANAFALAEAHFGCAQHHDVVLGIILGTGIGGGIVINNQVFSGANGTAGEWGHGTIVTTAPTTSLPKLSCHCGQPFCLDSYGSALGLQGIFEHIGGQQLTSIEIVDAWLANERSAISAVNTWLAIVSGALANVVNFIDPSIVVVGGGLSNAKPLIAALDNATRAQTLTSYNTPLLSAASHGSEQGLLGAFVQVQNNRTSNSKTISTINK